MTKSKVTKSNANAAQATTPALVDGTTIDVNAVRYADAVFTGGASLSRTGRQLIRPAITVGGRPFTLTAAIDAKHALEFLGVDLKVDSKGRIKALESVTPDGAPIRVKAYYDLVPSSGHYVAAYVLTRAPQTVEDFA